MLDFWYFLGVSLGKTGHLSRHPHDLKKSKSTTQHLRCEPDARCVARAPAALAPTGWSCCLAKMDNEEPPFFLRGGGQTQKLVLSLHCSGLMLKLLKKLLARTMSKELLLSIIIDTCFFHVA